MESTASLVLSPHRPESVIPSKNLMMRHNTVVLEEPPDNRFEKMVAGRMAIPTYLETLDLEYPEFSRQMAEALRDLHHNEIQLFQVEPYLERLIEIHEAFASGARPGKIRENPRLSAVYEAERQATAVLLQFYEISARGVFEATLRAVQHFARADAQRFLLRDRMRALEIAGLLKNPGSHYIEAGLMHYGLWRELKHRLIPDYPLKLTFLMAEVIHQLGYRGTLYGPGDLLTLRYIFHPRGNPPVNDLLAGQALIYNKLIHKEELSASPETYPHTRDELETIALARSLTLAECARLWPHIRNVSTSIARKLVRRHGARAAARAGLNN